MREVDLAAPASKRNPRPFYAVLRTEEPVCPVRLPDGQLVWLVTRYDDVVSVFRTSDSLRIARRLSPRGLETLPVRLASGDLAEPTCRLTI